MIQIYMVVAWLDCYVWRVLSKVATQDNDVTKLGVNMSTTPIYPDLHQSY